MTAIAADELDDMKSLQPKLPGISLVSDRNFAASKAWGRYINGADSPTPATYIVDGNGAIEWSHLPDDKGDWPSYAELVAALKI